MKRKYNVIKDERDDRDFIYTSKLSVSQLPQLVDLRKSCSPIVDQGALGSCTANAIVSGLREYMMVYLKQPLVRLSRLFLYYQERKIEGTIDQDSGAQIRDGMKVLNQMGSCPESEDPYNIANFKKAPTKKAIKDAYQYRVKDYYRVNTLNDLKIALSENRPVVCGIKVFSSFESGKVASSGIVPMPGPEETLLGGHAVLCVGYDEKKQLFIFRNSWGNWGDKGYFYIPYNVFNFLMMDMWTIKTLKNNSYISKLNIWNILKGLFGLK